MDVSDLSFRNAVAVTPHDTNANPATALKIGGAGNVAVRPYGSSADVTIAVIAGETLRLRVLFVRNTGTTATGIVALS